MTIPFTIKDCITFALESTVYIDPEQKGLTYRELYEVTERMGFKKGETDDALQIAINTHHAIGYFVDDHIYPGSQHTFLTIPFYKFKNDPRDFRIMNTAFEFILDQVKEQGTNRFALPIPFTVSSIVHLAKCSPSSARIALNLLAWYKNFTIKDDVITSPRNMAEKFVANIATSDLIRNNEENFLKVFNVIKEIISSRTQGTPVSSDPFKAFEEFLPRLNATEFSGWWQIQIMELHTLNHRICCSSALVVIASLCEGALAFFAHGKTGENLTMTKGIGSEPSSWTFANLINAGNSGSNPLFTIQNGLKERLTEVNDMRKIIHPSYFMSMDNGRKRIATIRPEQVERAQETLKTLLRRIIDWHLSLT